MGSLNERYYREQIADEMSQRKVEAVVLRGIEKRLEKAAAVNAIVSSHIHAMHQGDSIIEALTSCINMLAEHNNAMHKMLAKKAALETSPIVWIDGEIQPIDKKGMGWREVMQKRNEELALMHKRVAGAEKSCTCPGPAGSQHVYPCPHWKAES